MDYIHCAEKATNTYKFETLRLKRVSFVCTTCGFESYQIEHFCRQLTINKVKFFCRKQQCANECFPEGYPGTSDSFISKNFNS